MVDTTSEPCEISTPEGPDPSDNSCIAAWVEADSLGGSN